MPGRSASEKVLVICHCDPGSPERNLVGGRLAKVLALVEDLFFAAKIAETARLVGAELETLGTAEALLQRAMEDRPSLVIVDLNAPGAGRGEAIRQFKMNSAFSAIPVVGFLSHLQTDLAQAAEQAGCDRVMPRSEFAAELPEILRRLAE